MKKILFLILASFIFAAPLKNLQKRYENEIGFWKTDQFAQNAGMIVLDNNGEVLFKAGDKKVFDLNFTFDNKKMNFLTFAKTLLPEIKDSKHFKKIYVVNLPNSQTGKFYARKDVNGAEYFFAVFNKNQFERKFKNIEVCQVTKGHISYPQVKGTKWDKKINEYLKKYPKNVYAMNYRILGLNDYQLNIVYRIIVKNTYQTYKPPYEEYFLLKRICLHRNAYIITNPVISVKNKIYIIFDCPKKFKGYKVYQSFIIKSYK